MSKVAILKSLFRSTNYYAILAAYYDAGYDAVELIRILSDNSDILIDKLVDKMSLKGFAYVLIKTLEKLNIEPGYVTSLVLDMVNTNDVAKSIMANFSTNDLVNFIILGNGFDPKFLSTTFANQNEVDLAINEIKIIFKDVLFSFDDSFWYRVLDQEGKAIFLNATFSNDVADIMIHPLAMYKSRNKSNILIDNLFDEMSLEGKQSF